MKTTKQIREDYNRNRSSSDALEQLVFDGLLDESKLTLVRRALKEGHNTLTNAEKSALNECINSITSEKLEVELLDEAKKKDYLTKLDPRFSKKFPSDKEAPQIIILKRKGIRIFPDGAKIALYYAQGIDKYVSIPFGEIGVGSVNEEIKVGKEVEHDDGKKYRWLGAQWAEVTPTGKAGKAAKRDVQAKLTAKHTPKEKEKQKPVASRERAAMNTYGRDLRGDIGSAYKQMRGRKLGPVTSALASAAAIPGLAVNRFARSAAKDTIGGAKLAGRGMSRGAYAAYKRIRGMRKEEREVIENSFTTKVQQLREQTKVRKNGEPAEVTVRPMRVVDNAPNQSDENGKSLDARERGTYGKKTPRKPGGSYKKLQDVYKKTQKDVEGVGERLPKVAKGAARALIPGVTGVEKISQGDVSGGLTDLAVDAATLGLASKIPGVKAAVGAGTKKLSGVASTTSKAAKEALEKVKKARQARDQAKTQARKDRVAKRRKDREERKEKERFERANKNRQQGKPKRGGKGVGAAALAAGILSGMGGRSSSTSQSKTGGGQYSPELKATISAPTPQSAYSRQLDILNRQAQRQFASGQTMEESVLNQLNTIENIQEAIDFKFEDGSITVTPTMAKNMIKVYNNVNEDNKNKIELMINESAESLKKFINFASRY